MHIIKSFKGDFIGEGSSRIVYDYKHHQDWVIKELKKPPKLKKFLVDNNWLEYQNYLLFKKYNKEYWVSPCFYQNRYLIMKKTVPVPQIPQLLPSIFPNKISNWGILNNQLVCIDYEVLKFSKFKTDRRNYFRWNTKGTGYYIPLSMNKYFSDLKLMYNLKEENFSLKIINSKFILEKLLMIKREMKF